MTVLVAIPVFRIGCKVGIDRGRAWSVMDESILWSISRNTKTISMLASEANIPRQIITASIARLMRFRLVDAIVSEEAIAFKASDYGFKAIGSGAPLPFFPKRISRKVSFVIDWATGDFFHTRQIRLMPPYKLDEARKSGAEIRLISVEGGGPSMSHEANLNRLSDIAARGWDEQVAHIDGKSATMRDDEFMVLKVIDGVARGLPESAGQKLRTLVSEAAAMPRGTTTVPVMYSGPKEWSDTDPPEHPCMFNFNDLVIGGSEQRKCLVDMLKRAHRRVIIHSTFLDADRFLAMIDEVRAACIRGVEFDLIWGAEKDEDTERRNAAEAVKIAKLVREDTSLKGRFRVHLRTTGSHAKIIMHDTVDEGWVAGVGSCNWLSSPFQSVELSVILRDQQVVADVAVALQRLVGRRGLSDDIATEMALTARDLRREHGNGGSARISVVVGEMHDRLIRVASGAARQRFIVGSNRLGSTARPGAIMQGEKAAEKKDVQVKVLYTQTTGPLKNRHARALAEEAKRSGVTLTRTKKIPLHGKFIAWDDDDLVVTSLNWASASADADFPWSEIGIRIHAPDIAGHAMARLIQIFPELENEAP